MNQFSRRSQTGRVRAMGNSRALFSPGQIEVAYPQGYPRYFWSIPSSPALLHRFPTGLPTGLDHLLGFEQ